MATAPNGFSPKRLQPQMATAPNGYSPKRLQPQMAAAPNAYNPNVGLSERLLSQWNFFKDGPASAMRLWYSNGAHRVLPWRAGQGLVPPAARA